MDSLPYESTVPAGSLIAGHLAEAYFYDAWSIRSNGIRRSALEDYISAFEKTPKWVDVLMNLRNRIVAFFGLKDLGPLSGLQKNRPASEYQPGDRMGIFTLFENTDNEVLLGDKDKHLDVVLSIHRSAETTDKQNIVTVTTVVHVHNLLGRLYMLPVRPMHRLIAPAVLRAIGELPNG